MSLRIGEGANEDSRGALFAQVNISIFLFLIFIVGGIEMFRTIPGIRIRKLAHDDIAMSILFFTYLSALITLAASLKKVEVQRGEVFWLSLMSSYLGCSCFLNGKDVTLNGLPVYWIVVPALCVLAFSLVVYVFLCHIDALRPYSRGIL